jgi:hypothetical protein
VLVHWLRQYDARQGLACRRGTLKLLCSIVHINANNCPEAFGARKKCLLEVPRKRLDMAGVELIIAYCEKQIYMEGQGLTKPCLFVWAPLLKFGNNIQRGTSIYGLIDIAYYPV